MHGAGGEPTHAGSPGGCRTSGNGPGPNQDLVVCFGQQGYVRVPDGGVKFSSAAL